MGASVSLSQCQQFPDSIRRSLQLVHPSWLPVIIDGLEAVQAADPAYLQGLIEGDFLPTKSRIFAAFSQPMSAVNFVLVGEGPYPRAESATGVCFMDGAVGEIWSQELQGGLSKKVNRATSLRNFIKMLLVADGRLTENNTTAPAMAEVSSFARQANSAYIQTLSDLQANLEARGFLLLNASLVFRPEVKPSKDAKAWQPFLQVIFSALNEHQKSRKSNPIVLVLWGKIAEQLKQISVTESFTHVASEHPYNLSFIANKTMQNFFSPMGLLYKH
jgi:uracil-DNA glycosylase